MVTSSKVERVPSNPPLSPGPRTLRLPSLSSRNLALCSHNREHPRSVHSLSAASSRRGKSQHWGQPWREHFRPSAPVATIESGKCSKQNLIIGPVWFWSFPGLCKIPGAQGKEWGASLKPAIWPKRTAVSFVSDKKPPPHSSSVGKDYGLNCLSTKVTCWSSNLLYWIDCNWQHTL